MARDYNIRERMANRFEVDQRAALFGNRSGRATRSSEDHNAQSRDVLEQQNNKYIEDLEAKVGVLTDLTRNIGKEVKSSNSLLDAMGLDFDKAGGLLKGTLGQLKAMMQSKSGSHMCYLVAFVFVLLFLLYLLAKVPSFGRGTPTIAPDVVASEAANLSGLR